ncbi:MAG: ATP-binding protein [archaeon]
MKLLSLKVDNIRGIKTINLKPKGKNVVVYGPNGTGKSAIVDAIDFLFTGKISRLTGEGAKYLSLSEHGCHIDYRKKLENTVVIAEIEVNGQTVTLQRSIKTPSSLKIKPSKQSGLIKSYLKDAQLGQHVLSRKELLMYITSEGGQRAKKIMSLLNLRSIENLRTVFVSIKNRTATEINRTKTELNKIENEINNLLSIDNFSEKEVLLRINSFRTILDGDEISKLSPERIKQNLGRQFVTSSDTLTTIEIKNAIKSIKNLVEKKDNYATQMSTLTQLLNAIIIEKKLKKCLQYKRLYDAGIILVDKTNVCPLCGRPWNEGSFKEYLENKTKELKITQKSQDKINELSLAVKMKIASLKNNAEVLVKAHNQFSLEIDKQKAQAFFTGVEIWLHTLESPFETYQNSKWPKLKIEDVFLRPFLTDNLIKPIENELTRVGETFSTEQIAWDTLTKMEEKWQRYQDAVKLKKADELFNKRAERALRYFEEARDFILENVYDNIKDNFENYYKNIHGEDESDFLSKISHTEASLNFEVDFHNRGLFPPHALHSEGHQDSMGLCLFFALNNYLVKDTINVVVLDDVVMSIDGTHRRGVCKLLKNSFPDKQLIITTHDTAWANQLKSEGLVSKKNMVHFVNWNVDTGPIFEMDVDLWDRIKQDLDKDDVPSAAHKLRRNAECFFENICDCLKAPLEYECSHRWELGSYAASAISTYKKYLKLAKHNFQKFHQDEKYTELGELEKKVNKIVIQSQIEQWIINENVHYNNWANFSKNDFVPVVEAFKELFDLFICNSCQATIEIDKSKTKISCSCGEIFWNVNK